MSSWGTRGEKRESQGGLGCTGHGRRPLPRSWSLHSHVGLVVLSNLLDTHIIFGINEGLSSSIGLGQCHNTCDILEVMLVVYLDLGKGRKGVSLVRMGQQWAVGVPLGEGLHANDTGELSTQKPGGHTKALKYAQF